MREFTPKAAHDVAVGGPEGMAEAVVPVVAEDLGQRFRRPQARLGQLDLLGRQRVGDLASEAKALANPLRRLLQLRPRRLLVLEPPPPMLAATRRRGYQ
jgi:hypothetical protein